VAADVFAHAVAQTHPAASSDDTLPMLTAIRLDSVGDQLTLAATDRYRIAVTDTTWTPSSGPIGVCVPGRQLHDIARNLGHGDVTLAIDDKLAAISTTDRTATIRLLDDQFIDYRSRTTIDQPITATVDAPTLAAAVKRVALVADRKSTAIRLEFSGGEVLVTAGDAEIGRGSEAADAALDGADSIEIAFQAQFLLDVLSAINGPARIGMETSTKPALFRPEDDLFACLVMSLRTA
jgi:DNA polymerase-3 subunit beta